MELISKLEKKVPKNMLKVYNLQDLNRIYSDMSKKFERERKNSIRKLLLIKNKMKILKSSKKAYGVKRGVIILDDKENEIVKIYKKYNCKINDRFISVAKIYMKYMHDFNFTFKNTLTDDSLTIYYNHNDLPRMIITSYKNKNHQIVKKYRKVLNIGEKLEFLIKISEDNKGEHLNLNFFNFSEDFNHMLRIMDIESNCFFEIECDFNDEDLFDI